MSSKQVTQAKPPPEFSSEQWRFLAVLDAFGGTTPVDLAGHLAPLLPGPLFDLIRRAGDAGWLVRDDQDQFSLAADLPEIFRSRLDGINSPEHLLSLIGRMRTLPPEKQPAADMIISLLEKGGLGREAALFEIEHAEALLNSQCHDPAWRHLRHAAGCLMNSKADDLPIFISAVLQLSNLSFTLGKGISELAVYLHRAHEAARQIGNRRSHALINLHLGHLYYFIDRRADAMVALSVGLNEIEELADDDILDQSAVFLGLFYFMQGLFREALPHLDRAERVYRRQEKGAPATPLAPIMLGYCLAYLGEFHRAIGYLDCQWRMARDRSDHNLAATLRVILATVLILIKREKEAAFHLDAAIKEAEARDNVLARYLSWGAMALQFRKSGQMDRAHALLQEAFELGAASGLVRQYSSPWIMELFFEIERLGFPPIAALNFREIEKKAVLENNVHLQGVAWRLRAHLKIAENAPDRLILDDLEKSLACLEKSGDVVQISKTLIEKARLALIRKDRDEGRRLVENAWTVLGGYAEEFFPDDLRYLVDPDRHGRTLPETTPFSFDRYIELTEAMFPVHGRDEILSRAVEATNRFFGAERGGLFWFSGGRVTKSPELRAACNLTQTDISAESFRENLSLIIKSFTSNRPLLKRKRESGGSPEQATVKSILCLPVEIRGKTRAVLYHDNAYMEDCFDFLDDATLRKVVRHASRQVERIWEYYQVKEERNNLIEKTISITGETPDAGKELLFRSPVMIDRIGQMDRAAQSDSTILILGETGVGKELAARRVHAVSRRGGRTFIVVDAASIPETLIESELFGHEKGAFTGADRQKRGRLELADQGTLFIDEIGEIPPGIQVKLLRAIQERTFYRVGGTRTLRSDFRLIAATNRDLEAEVAAGRFRQDLYYRLNVVPVRIPPLRERKEDIAALAGYFLNQIARRYNRPDLFIDQPTLALLEAYDWPGNVRELENIMERAVLLSTGDRLEIDLSMNRLKKERHSYEDLPTIDELQERYIRYVLEKTGGRLGGPDGASKILGMKRTTLYARMKKLGMR